MNTSTTGSTTPTRPACNSTGRAWNTPLSSRSVNRFYTPGSHRRDNTRNRPKHCPGRGRSRSATGRAAASRSRFSPAATSSLLTSARKTLIAPMTACYGAGRAKRSATPRRSGHTPRMSKGWCESDNCPLPTGRARRRTLVRDRPSKSRRRRGPTRCWSTTAGRSCVAARSGAASGSPFALFPPQIKGTRNL